MIPVVEQVARLGWKNKAWTTTGGKPRGGRSIDKGGLWHILTNVTYAGKASHNGAVYYGEHDAIIESEVGAIRRGDMHVTLTGLSMASVTRSSNLDFFGRPNSAHLPRQGTRQVALAGGSRRWRTCGMVQG